MGFEDGLLIGIMANSKRCSNLFVATILNNKQRITLVSFLAYFAMSGMLAPIGIISGPMSEHFNLPITDITAGFSWLTFGILAGAVTALFIFNWIQLKRVIIVLYCLVALSLLSLLFLEDINYIWPTLGLIGVSAGIGLAGAALIISRTYEEDKRASMLVITDGWFSIAGIVCSWAAIFLVARDFHWSGAYQLSAFVVSAIVLLAVFSKFPSTITTTQDIVVRERWPLSVWLCVLSLFLYTLGQTSMLWWLPTYAETQLGAPRDQAGILVSQFWTGMFAAQIFVSWWVLRIGVQRLVLLAGVTASICSASLWTYQKIDGLVILALIWGFANLGLLKLILSLATQMIQVPSARLISTLLLGASLGTAVSPWLTSQIVAATSTHFILKVSTGLYVTLTLLMFVATHLYRSQQRSQSGADLVPSLDVESKQL